MRMRQPGTLLLCLGILETTTLAAMLMNLWTVDSRSFAAVAGPTHGFTWLAILVVCLLLPGLSARQRVVATIPGVGGLLAVLTIRRAHAATSEPGDPALD